MFSSLLWQLAVYDVKQSGWQRCTQPEETSANIGSMYQNRACCLQRHTLQQLLWYARITHTHMHISMYSVLRSATAPSSKPDKSFMILSLSETAVCRQSIRSHWKFLLGTYKDLFGDLYVKVPWETSEQQLDYAHRHSHIFHRVWQTNTKAQHSTNIWFLHGSAPNPKLNCNTAHILSEKNNQRIKQKISNLRSFRA